MERKYIADKFQHLPHYHSYYHTINTLYLSIQLSYLYRYIYMNKAYYYLSCIYLYSTNCPSISCGDFQPTASFIFKTIQKKTTWNKINFKQNLPV